MRVLGNLLEGMARKIDAMRWNVKLQKHITEKVYEMNNGQNVQKSSKEIYERVINRLSDGQEYTYEECIELANETLEEVAISMK